MKTKIIHVKQEHIDAGTRICAGRCPMSLAIKEQVECYHVTVAYGHVRFYAPDKRVESYAILPRSANRFVKNFDLFRAVAPFRFRLKREAAQ